MSPDTDPKAAAPAEAPGTPGEPPAPRTSWFGRRLGRNGFSTQFYLIALVVALIGPGLLFTAILLMRYAAAERARF